MAYQIDSSCIGCGACASECPTSCIAEDGGVFKVNEAECIECGSCANVCPVGAPKLA
ncbi:ferredoxin [Tyzzerella sp. An114]|uniref:indolepyruvate ferredoxin oxidoreductase subunit alpha n=1 Tax=Tyzzerella sp. An114 TaxID=1965545 RepID=UPI000B4425ED|nr:4Fe-4S binding protein [Tyzzerella sp. An114]OUQ58770.1 ferredoxin [Tyzzerella sp. An114]HIT73822.1 4Fe-4S binding protein [Candidatus Fimicola cottocaccae]